MKYNFDEIIVRKGTDCVKYDAVKELWGRDDLLPMWVADMDFRTPDFIVNSIRFGISVIPDQSLAFLQYKFFNKKGEEIDMQEKQDA